MNVLPDRETGRIRVPDHVHHVDDDMKHIVVMNAENGKIFGLDNSAAVMWRVLAESGSESAAAAAAAERYGIDLERAETDVRDFVDELLAAGLLVRDPESTGSGATGSGATDVEATDVEATDAVRTDRAAVDPPVADPRAGSG